ncbi:hypothetical protein KIM67_16485 [Flagellimonas sp. 389]|uniref:hypothetical protein n=1 Tax=Flagellimonas sp. 389 TaxID=2835862 RepID=UPI001BD4E3E4|nr:hypothetical protein [Flagellimonas sp. 389]MBS9464021.1 hypothetical protein [Flagellimonas sp. 389]
MRIIKFFLIGLFFGQSCNVKSQFQNNSLAIECFIEDKINQREFDIRIYDPPPPPELRDSIKHNGQIKPDSIIERLAPLHIYINESITYDNVFKPKVVPDKDFDFIDSKKKKKGGEFLEVKSITKKKGIILNSFSSNDFLQLYELVNLQKGYGGFVTFKNLYYSEDGRKAYFEFILYRRRLNSSTAIIYAEKRNDGSWKFKMKAVSIS